MPPAARSTGCVDIASDSVLHVAQWSWYVCVVSGSGQTRRTKGKCLLFKALIPVRLSTYYWGDQICDQLRNCLILKKLNAPCISLTLYSPLRDLFFYTNRPAVRSSQAVYGCSKLICQTHRSRNIQVWRFVARGRFGKFS